MGTDPQRWAQIKAALEAALELPPAARDALLAASGLDAAAQAEVRSLLLHHSQATGGADFLQQPAGMDGQAAAVAQAAARTGQRLGAWQIVRAVGAGGMGEVFEARRADGSFEGRAAVKLLKRGMDSHAVLQRFAQERQALARLNHPHIARLLDAGASEEGLPYFVMEYVDGRAIHEAALGLPLEQRLQLFLQLADAVSYAHRNLLVHRDLKPGNVLVDGDGQVKLLDFGIAKALDPLEAVPGGAAADATLGGQRPYTPHYASPEQVRGEPVSTATDIYSLGVLLYQMLTGTRPTGRHATTPMQAARAVLEEEPTRPSRLSGSDVQDPQWLATRKRLQGDLDNILLKALDKHTATRYASVDALASDLHAYLEGRPVSARAASVGYVAAKFVRRHRAAVLTAGVGALGLLTALVATVLQGRLAVAGGVLVLAGGLVMALVQARQAALSRDDAARARDDARQQLARIKRITTDLVFRYGDTVQLLPGGARAQEALLRETVASLEPALQGAPDDLDLVSTMVAALGRLAEIQGNTTLADPGKVGEAQATVARAQALAEQAWPQRQGDWRFVNWHLRTLVVRAQLLRGQGQLQAAVDTLRLVATRAEQSLPRQSSSEGRMYLVASLTNAHLTRAQMHDHAHLPSLHQPEEALQAYALAEKSLRAQLLQTDELQALDRAAAEGDASTEAYLRHQLAVLLGGRALVLERLGRLDEAAYEIDEAVALHQGNVQCEPQVVIWRDGLMCESSTQGLVRLRQGQVAQALQATTRAYDTLQALAAQAGPQSKWAQPPTQAAMGLHHGRALVAAGRAAEALPLLQQALAHWQAQPPGDTLAASRAAAVREQLGLAQRALGGADAGPAR
ncbi:MAG: serine/threonine protein kinase [Rubrivivax sp.]|nr:serine/threonine protein kinase [Rubrivivax sp.]